MSEFNMTLLPKYFDLISEGKKIYEVRLKKDEKKLVKANDIISFRRRPQLDKIIRTKVEEIYEYRTFKEAIEAFPKGELGFEENMSIEEIIRVYREIYPKEEEEREYGVIVYKLKKLK